MNRDFEYLQHILDSCTSILKWNEGMQLEAFIADEKLVSAVVRKLEIIGEASTRISPDFKKANPEIPWREMKAMRNKLIHEYDNVNLRAVFSTVCNDLPSLRHQIETFLRKSGR